MTHQHLHAPGQVALQTLGGLVLRRDGAVLGSGRKPLALLAWLACHPRERHDRARLAALFWDVDERRARQSLRQALLTLRALLGEEALVQDGETVALADGAIAVDLAAFAADLHAGRDEAAIERWTGDFLPGLEGMGSEDWRVWLEAERQRLRTLFGLACERRVAAARAQGDWAGAVRAAERWADALSVDAGAHTHLIECLLLADRAHDAAAAAAGLLGRWREQELEPPAALRKLAAEAASHATSSSQLPASFALFTPELVGRGEVLGDLAAVWRSVRGGAGTGVLLEGAVGSGRTRVADELTRVASQEEPCVLLRTSCYEGERDVPWAVLRDLLEALAAAPGLSGAPDEDLALLAVLSPRLRERYTRLPRAAAPEPPAVARALVRVLDDVGTEAPVLVVVDDFDACDTASRDVICALLRRTPARTLVLLVCDETAQRRDLDELAAHGDLRRVRVPLLDRGGTEEMLRSMLDLPGAERAWLADRLYAETGGLPLAIAGIISALADDGLVSTADGGWQLHASLRDGSLPLPDSVRAAVLRRLSRLAPAARSLLEAAAAAPAPVAAAALRRVCGLDTAAFEGGIDLLVTSRLLRTATAPTGMLLEPWHPLLRRILLEEMNPARRDHLEAAHRAAASASVLPRSARVWRRIAAAAAVVVAVVSLRFGVLRPELPRDTVAVLPFSVHGGAGLDYLGEGMVDLLSMSLNGTAGLRTVDPHALLASIEPGDALSLRAARRAAARFDAGTFITGSVIASGGALRVRASIYEGGGRPVVVEVQAPAESELFVLTDALARRVLGALFAETEHFAAPTTESLPALRAYLAGRQAARRGHYSEASDHFRDAIAHDSLFSLARYQLALATEFSGVMDPLVFRETIAGALRHAERLPWQERELLRAFEQFHFGSAATAEARLRALLAEHPNSVEAWHTLAEVLMHAGPRTGRRDALADARAAFERVLRLDPGHAEAQLHLVRVALALGDTAGAARYVIALSQGPLAGSAVVGGSEILLAWVTASPAQRAALARTMREQHAVRILVPAYFLAVYAGDARAAAEVAAAAATRERPATQRAAAHAYRAFMFAADAKPDSARAQLAAASALHPRQAARTGALIASAPASAFTDEERLGLLRELGTFAGEDPHLPEDLRYVTHVPGMDVAFDTYAAGLLHAALGEYAQAESMAGTLERARTADPQLAADLARGLRADVLFRRATEPGSTAAGRDLGSALALLEAIRYESWHQAAMASAFHALARERRLRADVLRALGRDAEAAAWEGAVLHSTPYDLLFRRRED